MALLGIEGFDHENSTYTDLPTKPNWTTAGSSFSKQTGRISGSCLRSANNTNSISYSFTATASPIVGFAFRISSYPGSTSSIFSFQDSGTAQIGLAMTSTGHLAIYRTNTSTILATGSSTIATNTWYYLEFKTTINDTTGTYDLHINGVSELSGTGADTKNTANASANGLTHVFFSSINIDIDDWYLLNNTGSSPYNDFLGDTQVETLFVSTNNTVAWTPLSSTNASNVDDPNQDADSTYNSTSSSSTVDLFNHTSLASTPTTIFAVQIAAAGRSDSTSINFRTKLKSGTTTQNGATKSISTSYLYTDDIYITDPDTTIAWTASGVNSALIGYENI